MTNNQGIRYQLTGESQRGRVCDYHRKPHPLNANRTTHAADVSGLKKVDRDKAVKFNGFTYESKFTIGFEVEKNRLSRGAVREYELFCGFERDSSCGYEAVTHILPLLPAGSWRNKVFDMMFKARKIIDDQFSPSDSKCGGHITIGVNGMGGEDIMHAMRGNCGILMAIFRKRLGTFYCNHNPRMLSESDFYSGPWRYHSKYRLALPKSYGLEFRLPSRFQSVKQMMRRYEMMHIIVDHSINSAMASHKLLLDKLTPVLMSMYEGDTAKVDEMKRLAGLFRDFILTGRIDDDIRGFLEGAM